MVKLLGIIDIIIGLVFLASYFRLEVSKEMILFFGIYCIIKALFFLIISFDFLSLIDILAGASLVFLFFFTLPSLILIIFALLLLLKGLISVFS